MREPKQLNELQSPEALQELRSLLQDVVQAINFFRAPTFTTATRPAASQAGAGAIVFISDAAAGSNYQGSTGSAWVSLG